jgi:protein phosphatase PTC7
MEVAYLSTTARGSSTACILCLENDRLHASNLGDSGFMVIRDGELMFMSPQQQHEFNFPYQIGSPDSMSDTPQVGDAAGAGCVCAGGAIMLHPAGCPC